MALYMDTFLEGVQGERTYFSAVSAGE